MAILTNFWWIWLIGGLFMMSGGGIWIFKDTTSRMTPMYIAILGAIAFWIGIISFVIKVIAPWFVRHFGH